MSFQPGWYRGMDGRMYEVVSTVRDASRGALEWGAQLRRTVLFRDDAGECASMPVVEWIEEIWTGDRFARRFQLLGDGDGVGVIA